MIASRRPLARSALALSIALGLCAPAGAAAYKLAAQGLDAEQALARIATQAGLGLHYNAEPAPLAHAIEAATAWSAARQVIEQAPALRMRFIDDTFVINDASAAPDRAERGLFTVASLGDSAKKTLHTIAARGGLRLQFDGPDALLAIDVEAATAWSAAQQVVADIGYQMRLLDDRLVVAPELGRDKLRALLGQRTMGGGAAPAPSPPATERFNLTLRDTPIAEAMEMLAQRGRVNVLLAPGATGTVSTTLFDVDLEEAIRAVASAAGLRARHQGGGWWVDRADSAALTQGADVARRVRTFKIQYSNPDTIEKILNEYLSEQGTLTLLPERRMVVVRDEPEQLAAIAQVLGDIDIQPRQILIEAKILEINLTDEETFGIDWTQQRGDDQFGTQGLAVADSAGFFLKVVSDELSANLSALNKNGRVRTLSTPKLLVLEDQSAEVVVGDKIGFKTTTVTDGTATESVQFLESGVILRVKASVDNDERILLDIHPEVSSGKLNDGLPNQTTTEVTTNLLADSGDQIFIGGLLRRTETDNDSGVPLLSRVPLLGNLFKQNSNVATRTETVVLITPRLLDSAADSIAQAEVELQMGELMDDEDWFFETLPAITVRN